MVNKFLGNLHILTPIYSNCFDENLVSKLTQLYPENSSKLHVTMCGKLNSNIREFLDEDNVFNLVDINAYGFNYSYCCNLSIRNYIEGETKVNLKSTYLTFSDPWTVLSPLKVREFMSGYQTAFDEHFVTIPCYYDYDEDPINQESEHLMRISLVRAETIKKHRFPIPKPTTPIVICSAFYFCKILRGLDERLFTYKYARKRLVDQLKVIGLKELVLENYPSLNLCKALEFSRSEEEEKLQLELDQKEYERITEFDKKYPIFIPNNWEYEWGDENRGKLLRSRTHSFWNYNDKNNMLISDFDDYFVNRDDPEYQRLKDEQKDKEWREKEKRRFLQEEIDRKKEIEQRKKDKQDVFKCHSNKKALVVFDNFTDSIFFASAIIKYLKHFFGKVDLLTDNKFSDALGLIKDKYVDDIFYYQENDKVDFNSYHHFAVSKHVKHDIPISDTDDRYHVYNYAIAYDLSLSKHQQYLTKSPFNKNIRMKMKPYFSFDINESVGINSNTLVICPSLKKYPFMTSPPELWKTIEELIIHYAKLNINIILMRFPYERYRINKTRLKYYGNVKIVEKNDFKLAIRIINQCGMVITTTQSGCCLIPWITNTKQRVIIDRKYYRRHNFISTLYRGISNTIYVKLEDATNALTTLEVLNELQ